MSADVERGCIERGGHWADPDTKAPQMRQRRLHPSCDGAGMSDARHSGMHAVKNQDPRHRGKKPPFDENAQRHPGSETEMREKPDHGELSYRGAERLLDKVALVTGADSGIGRAVALAFAREGADVAIVYYDEHDDAKETERLVTQAGRRALLLPGDLADPAFCETIVTKTVEELGHLDIVVNNAAHQAKSAESFADLTAERVERTFRVNILAMFHIVREALEHMPPGATIINTASIQAYKPSAAILDYAVTKAAIVAFTKGLAPSAIEQGIRVNCVAPGPVWTPLIAQSFEGKKLKEFGKKSPMKRPAQPAELAPAYVFLASAESSYVNGEILGVTGGSPLA
jgi:NAD(P)-dependent dehydrogenase (short-subunit alcohol dehydrogenase family)